jgi:L-2,4-diaminobutyrate transaminase
MFGSDYYGIRPDLITIAKGLTSAYAPLSGSIVVERVWDVLARGTDEGGVLGHGWTYSAHPIGAAAGVANLKVIDDLGLVANARETGAYFNKALKAALAHHPQVGEVRGEGLLAAVELVADKASRRFHEPEGAVGGKVTAALLKRGVIARSMPQGDIIGFAPPLCLSQAEADIIVAATVEAVTEVCGEF